MKKATELHQALFSRPNIKEKKRSGSQDYSANTLIFTKFSGYI